MKSTIIRYISTEERSTVYTCHFSSTLTPGIINKKPLHYDDVSAKAIKDIGSATKLIPGEKLPDNQIAG